MMDRLYYKYASRLALLAGGSEDDREVYLYALRFWGSTLITAGLLLSAAWLTNSLSLVGTSAICAGGLRIFAGGAHQQKAAVCTFMTLTVHLGIAGLLTIWLPVSPAVMWGCVIFATLFVGWAVVKHAPADVPTKPIEGEERSKFRRRSFLLYSVISACLIGLGCFHFYPETMAGCLGFIWQGFSMTETGYRLAKQVDRLG
ncbi:MAG: accessory gene regulator B family protein [Heliobacteriaceae bacterium]|nr:accessory gene regulator B family protein [Heliobacteriaceae bacterium]